MDHFPTHIMEMIETHVEPETIVNSLLDVHADLVPTTVCHLLVCAIHFGHKPLFDYLLLHHGTDVNGDLHGGYATSRPLNTAVSCGLIDCIVPLLEKGASVNLRAGVSIAPATEIWSSVEFALISDRVDILTLLLPTFDGSAHGTSSLLHLACRFGAYDCTQHLLNNPDLCALINTFDSTNKKPTPLMYAVRHGLKLTKLLLAHGASAIIQSPGTGMSALHASIMRNFDAFCPSDRLLPPDLADIVRLLSEAGCDVNAPMTDNETPLGMLCSHVICECRTPEAKLPYDDSEHRLILVETCKVLLTAAECCNSSEALNILGRYLGLILSLFGHGTHLPASCEFAVDTCYEIMVLIFQHSSCVLSNPEHTSANLLRQFLSFGSAISRRWDASRRDASRTANAIHKIIRLLFVSGLELPCNELVEVLCGCFPLYIELFLDVLEMLHNIADASQSRWLASVIRSQIALVIQSDKHKLTRDEIESFQQRVNQIFVQPRLLRQICRRAFLRGVRRGEQIRIVSALADDELPGALKEYLLSLQN